MAALLLLLSWDVRAGPHAAVDKHAAPCHLPLLRCFLRRWRWCSSLRLVMRSAKSQSGCWGRGWRAASACSCCFLVRLLAVGCTVQQQGCSWLPNNFAAAARWHLSRTASLPTHPACVVPAAVGNDQYNPKYEAHGYQDVLGQWTVPASVIFGFLFMLNHQRYWRHHEFWGTALFALPIVMLPAIRCACLLARGALARALGQWALGGSLAVLLAAAPLCLGIAWHDPPRPQQRSGRRRLPAGAAASRLGAAPSHCLLAKRAGARRPTTTAARRTAC